MRVYHVEMTWRSKGDRYEITETTVVHAGNAGVAVTRAFREICLRNRKNPARKIREVLGGYIRFKVYVSGRSVNNKEVLSEQAIAG